MTTRKGCEYFMVAFRSSSLLTRRRIYRHLHRPERCPRTQHRHPPAPIREQHRHHGARCRSCQRLHRRRQGQPRHPPRSSKLDRLGHGLLLPRPRLHRVRRATVPVSVSASVLNSRLFAGAAPCRTSQQVPSGPSSTACSSSSRPSSSSCPRSAGPLPSSTASSPFSETTLALARLALSSACECPEFVSIPSPRCALLRHAAAGWNGACPRMVPRSPQAATMASLCAIPNDCTR